MTSFENGEHPLDSYRRLLRAYRTQFPKFMDSLLDQESVPYIPTHATKKFNDLTDEDLKLMKIPGRYRYRF